MCGICAELCISSCAEARIPLAQHAAAFERRHRLARGADVPADPDRRALFASEKSASTKVSRNTLSPQSSCTSEDGSVRAATMSTTAGSSSYSTTDLRGDVFGFGARARNAHRDRLADVADLVLRQRPKVRGFEALERRDGADRLYAVEILHGEHARLESGGLADAEDASVRDRRAHEGDFEHARAPDVADELAKDRAGSGRLPCAGAKHQRRRRSFSGLCRPTKRPALRAGSKHPRRSARPCAGRKPA